LSVLAILATPTFSRAVKRLHAKDKLAVDKAVIAIASNPAIGEEKKGDLAGTFVHKFKINKQEVLLAYQLQPNKFAPDSIHLLRTYPGRSGEVDVDAWQARARREEAAWSAMQRRGESYMTASTRLAGATATTPIYRDRF
jgi:hypothetical protein